jgi:hypothetical protein
MKIIMVKEKVWLLIIHVQGMIISFKLKDEWIELLNAYNFEITL